MGWRHCRVSSFWCDDWVDGRARPVLERYVNGWPFQRWAYPLRQRVSALSIQGSGRWVATVRHKRLPNNVSLSAGISARVTTMSVMRRLVLLTLLLGVTRPALAQDRYQIWPHYDSLPPSLSIAEIERRLGLGFAGFFGHEEIACVDRSRSVPGAWALVSATTEPYAYLLVTLPDAVLLVAATDSALTFRVEEGRHERVF